MQKINKKDLRNQQMILVLLDSGYITRQVLGKIFAESMKSDRKVNIFREAVKGYLAYLGKPGETSPHLEKMETLSELKKDRKFLKSFKSLKKESSITKYSDYESPLDFLGYSIKQGLDIESIKSRIVDRIVRLRKYRHSSSKVDSLSLPLHERPSFQKIMSEYIKTKNHSPKDSKKYYGIELEVIFKSEASLKSFETEVNRVKRVTITTDGSLSSPKEGSICREIKILTDDSFDNLKKVCDSLIGKAFVNKTCGMHVHLDMRGHSFKTSTLQNRINPLLQTLKYLVPESRRTNRYCQLRVGGHDRYVAVNTQSLSKHGTVEVRLHSGTIEFSKITNWIKLWSKLIQSKRLNKIDLSQCLSTDDRVSKMLTDLNLGESLTQYYYARYLELNPRSGSLQNDTEQTLENEAAA